MSVAIPQPPALPLLGNVTNLDPKNSLASLQHLAEKYGSIFKLNLLGREAYFISSAALLDEICDEKRFHKVVEGPLKQVRNGLHDGLFTAFDGESNWNLAHRILVPAFGPLPIRDMFDEMYDIASQLVNRWARTQGERIHVTDDYTRLTLDSIALCAMDKRFNSFYHEDMHPFVTAMVDFLSESGKRTARTSIEMLLSRSANAKYQSDINLMKQIAQEVIDTRLSNPSLKKDLLNALLNGRDPQSGERMSNDLIINNMITFLIAGHETTSGMLSFATYYLLKHPDVAEKASAELARVVGDGRLRYEHLSKLPYIEAILRETLRLNPTAPAFSVKAHEGSGPVLLAGKYLVPEGAAITALLPAVGRDAEVFGDDAMQFKPERMLGDAFSKLPPNCWKPFGNGKRGCIGRPFAWQEAILTLAMVLQHFNLRFDDSSYALTIKQTLTIKPADFYMRVTLKSGLDAVSLEKRLFMDAQPRDSPAQARRAHTQVSTRDLKPLSILYGSNSGTCEGLARALANESAAHGYKAQVDALDSAVDHMKVEQPCVILTASYEGEAPDNAKSFVEWLSTLPKQVQGMKYAVFGCGHSDWVSTYQKIPNYIDSQLERCGAVRLVAKGETNVSKGSILDDFDSWQDKSLWSALNGNARSETVTEGLDIELDTKSRAGDLDDSIQDALVISNDLLTALGAPEKRHIQLRLPTNMSYEPGDYLAILPCNSNDLVRRVFDHFHLPWDTSLTLKQGNHSFIPTAKQTSVSVLLSSYAELNVPASRKNIALIASYTSNEIARTGILRMSNETDGASMPSVLTILEAHPEVDLPFNVFLSMLQPMRKRQYSISSSPLTDPTLASITFSIAGARTKYPGVASTYLQGVKAGSCVQVAVKKPHATFHPPADIKTPILMACAGTGLAPFRGFVQHRVAKIKANTSGQPLALGQALLFVGCRDPAVDQLFKDEFEEAERLGAVKVMHAFSKAPEQSMGCRYVQDRIFLERDRVSQLFDQGAMSYICGSSAVGEGIADAVAKIAVERAQNKGETLDLDAAKAWWNGLRNERFAVDVFA